MQPFSQVTSFSQKEEKNRSYIQKEEDRRCKLTLNDKMFGAISFPTQNQHQECR